MNKTRQLGLLAAVAVLAIVGGGWFLLISPQRSKVADLHHQQADQQQKNGQLSLQISRLKAESRDLPAEQAKLAAIAEQLPPNPSMPALVNDLTKAAKRSGVDLQVIAPQTPVAFGSTGSVQLGAGSGTTGSSTSTSTTTTTTTSGSAATPSPSASAGTSSSGSSSSSTSTSSSSSGSSTGATSGTGTTTLSQSGVLSAGGLYQIPMSVTVVGTYYQITQFVNQLENLHRAYLVTQLNLQPGDPLAAASNAAAGTGGGSSSGPSYTGALTAQVNGFVFEVLTAPPATGTTTLPSSASGH
jgi:Tfp pilus assembly protein PilO